MTPDGPSRACYPPSLVDANLKRVIDRFVEACQRDPRVVAAFLYGSHATGEADIHSDIDLGVITIDQSHDEFFAQRAEFVKLLGEALFLEDFDIPVMVFAILADGAEVELAFGRESDFAQMAPGPFSSLVDKRGLLTEVTLRECQPDPHEQLENLRRLITWFWHDVSHFVTAIARGHLWWAYGQLEALRRYCVSLVRLQYNFEASAGGDEPYFKVQLDLPVEMLARLEPTLVPLERLAIYTAGRSVIDFYRSVAPQLAQAHGLSYPTALERIMLDRLDHVT